MKTTLPIFVLIFAVFCGGFLSLSTGCGYLNRQGDAESRLASSMIWWLKLNDVQSPGVPATNMAQLFGFSKHGYLYSHHRELVAYGRNRGFTNSLAEKYLFFWPRVTNAQMEGEIVCMNALPFRANKALYRIYIARAGSNYIQRMISEERAQTVMKEVKPGTVLPPNFTMPKPPPEAQEILHPSLSERYEKFVWDLSGALGQDSSMPVRWLLRGTCVLIFMAVVVWVVLVEITLPPVERATVIRLDSAP